MISSVFGNEKKLQCTSQSQSLHQKKFMVTVWWLLPVWFTTAFWILANHYIWEVCSANWWDAPKIAMPAASTGQQKGPNSSPRQCPTACHTTNASKVERSGLQNFASSIIFTWLLANHHFFKHLDNFLQGKPFHNQQEAEKAFEEFIESGSMDFYATGINKLISFGKNVLIVMVPILISVLEPSYGDLKFMVHNHNYVCTNLTQSYGNQNSMVITQKQTYKPMEQNRVPRNRKPTCLQSIYL